MIKKLKAFKDNLRGALNCLNLLVVQKHQLVTSRNHIKPPDSSLSLCLMNTNWPFSSKSIFDETPSYTSYNILRFVHLVVKIIFSSIHFCHPVNSCHFYFTLQCATRHYVYQILRLYLSHKWNSKCMSAQLVLPLIGL